MVCHLIDDKLSGQFLNLRQNLSQDDLSEPIELRVGCVAASIYYADTNYQLPIHRMRIWLRRAEVLPRPFLFTLQTGQVLVDFGSMSKTPRD